MRIGEVAKQLNVSVSTVRNYTNQGLINNNRNRAGQRTYTQQDIDNFLGKDKNTTTVFYVRSSSGNTQLINTQIEELTQHYGEPEHVYKDRTSGLNENRKGLEKLIRDAENNKFNRVCITYPDRITRFGITYIRKILELCGVELVILHAEKKYSLEEELMQDFMNLIASFSGKFYRLRSKQSQEKLLDKARKELHSD